MLLFLAGRMKLNHFLIIVGAVCVLGIGWCSTRPAPPEPERPRGVSAPRTPDDAPPKPSTQPKTAPEKPRPAPAATPDEAIFQWVGKDLGTKKIKDASKRTAFKINLYQDAGKPTLNRAKVDLDRDDKWDHKYTIDGDQITRKVAPGDDENYTVEERWTGDAWVAN